MAKKDRTGNKRRPRRENLRAERLAYYLVVTDAAETEKNYLQGLREALPPAERDHIEIVVRQAKKSEDLVAAVLEYAARAPQYRECWIVFDRDRVVPFDEIIAKAQREDIRVGWSNPCIEIWFDAYFGDMHGAYQDSVKCCSGFAQTFARRTGSEYKKSSKDLYAKLAQYGDEASAIRIARDRLRQFERDGVHRPSQQCPATTLHELVAEIRVKTQRS